jgi:hypothetical protein
VGPDHRRTPGPVLVDTARSDEHGHHPAADSTTTRPDAELDAATGAGTADPDAAARAADLDTLKAELSRAGVGADPQIVAAARELLEAVDPDGARAGKYALHLRRAQVGNHNTNTITFGTSPPA